MIRHNYLGWIFFVTFDRQCLGGRGLIDQRSCAFELTGSLWFMLKGVR